jgi:iron complex transport system substrate-binding protein
MKRRHEGWIRAVALAFAFAWNGSVAQVTAKNDRGEAVTLPRPATRVVALAPSLAEAAHFAGAETKLVGVSSYTAFPPRAVTLPVVASPGRIDLERLAVLAPDLVLGWRSGNPARQLERVERPGRAVFVTEPHTLADLAALVRSVGTLTGTPDEAAAAARAFESELDGLRPTLRASVRVFIEISADPPMTVNDTHLIADIVRQCGGENVFGRLATLTPRISMEQLLVAQPDAIVTSAPLATLAERERWMRSRAELRAVRRGRVVSIEGDVLHRQSFRVMDAVRAVCEGLQAPRAIARAPGGAAP